MNAPSKVVPATVGSLLTVLGDRVLLKFTSPDTNGLFTLTKQFNTPGTGIPLHRHTRENERFWVLEGQVGFVVADTTTIIEVHSCPQPTTTIALGTARKGGAGGEPPHLSVSRAARLGHWK